MPMKLPSGAIIRTTKYSWVEALGHCASLNFYQGLMVRKARRRSPGPYVLSHSSAHIIMSFMPRSDPPDNFNPDYAGFADSSVMQCFLSHRSRNRGRKLIVELSIYDNVYSHRKKKKIACPSFINHLSREAMGGYFL